MDLMKGAQWTVLAGLSAAAMLVGAAGPAAAIVIDDTPPPTVTVSPSTDLVDGQTVTVEGSGFPFSQPVSVRQCSSDLSVCTTPIAVTTTTSGSFSTTTAVKRRIGIDSYDCSSGAGACVIDVQGNGGGAGGKAELTFKAPK